MTLLLSLILCLFTITTFHHSKAIEATFDNDPIVDTLTGKVQGSIVKSDLTGEDYLAFKGIPYAKPPVGQLRFEDPEPIEPWSGVREAKNYSPACAQYDYYGKVSGDDCLYVNVFVKGLKVTDRKLPVMVWIHGGSWLIGYGDDIFYGPDYFMRKDIVLVTFNYRLGVFGFLNLEDEEAPGNQGLQDQVLVLKWVRDNIARFGGDPDNVTIFGNSAGGMSVHILCLSPAAKGLFHKAIIQSGNIYHPVKDIVDPKNFAYKLCEILGYNGTRNHTEIKEFLKKIDSEKLADEQEKLIIKEDSITRMFPFGLSLDIKAKNPVIPIKYDEAALQGIQMPLLIGYNSYEELRQLKNIGHNLKKWNENFQIFFPPTCPQYIKNEYNITLNDLKRLYFDDGKITEKNRKNITNLFCDIFWIEGTHKTLKIQVEKSTKPTYFYVYTYDKTLSSIKKVLDIDEKGAMHEDELDNLFRHKIDELMNILPPQKGTDPYRLMEQMIEMWVNFATTGNPTPTTTDLLPTKWLPMNDTSNLLYLNIGENLRMEKLSSMVDRLTRLNLSSPL